MLLNTKEEGSGIYRDRNNCTHKAVHCVIMTLLLCFQTSLGCSVTLDSHELAPSLVESRTEISSALSSPSWLQRELASVKNNSANISWDKNTDICCHVA